MDKLKSVGLETWAHHKPNELSGGQRQRVAIARALVNNPHIIMADEPTGNLDTKSTKDIMRLFEELHEDHKTIILVTHEPEIAACATRQLLLSDGKITKMPERGSLWMLFSESVQIAITALLSNKLRSILTMLGIIIGVGAVSP